jgi:hypothetical protein
LIRLSAIKPPAWSQYHVRVSNVQLTCYGLHFRRPLMFWSSFAHVMSLALQGASNALTWGMMMFGLLELNALGHSALVATAKRHENLASPTRRSDCHHLRPKVSSRHEPSFFLLEFRFPSEKVCQSLFSATRFCRTSFDRRPLAATCPLRKPPTLFSRSPSDATPTS